VTRYVRTPLDGVVVLEPDPFEDERGLFARTWDADQARGQGLDTRLSQCSTSFNRRRGTLRGLHYQVPPSAESKLVRCTRGSVYDVAVDLRNESPTRLRWYATELTADNRRGLYIPEGCAHGFVTLVDDAEVFYQISAPYVPEAARVVRWDDPAFQIEWPVTPTVMSARDASCPDLRDEEVP
jgi:dTDP-4-dehydrorhamnose 3,5-epimerase